MVILPLRRRNRGGQKASDDNGFSDGGGYMAVKKAKLVEQFNKVSNCEKIVQNL